MRAVVTLFVTLYCGFLQAADLFEAEIALASGEHAMAVIEVNGDNSGDWRAGVILCNVGHEKELLISNLNQGIWPVIRVQTPETKQPILINVNTFDIKEGRSKVVRYTCNS